MRDEFKSTSKEDEQEPILIEENQEENKKERKEMNPSELFLDDAS